MHRIYVGQATLLGAERAIRIQPRIAEPADCATDEHRHEEQDSMLEALLNYLAKAKQ